MYEFLKTTKIFGPQSIKVYAYLTMLENWKFRKRINIALFPVLFLSEADFEKLKSEFFIAVFVEIQVTLSLGEKFPTF
jgi:hypothetical protein